MTTRFADTFFFLALAIPEDPAHEAAKARAADRSTNLLTTSWVLVEVADALSSPANRAALVRLYRRLAGNAAIEIIPPDLKLLERGINLFERRPDKGWSLTDCISFVVMTDRSLTDALTGDHHFEQAGFRALLRE